MSGGRGHRGRKARELEQFTPNQLVVYQKNGRDCLARFVQRVGGAPHRAVVVPWYRETLWENPTIVVGRLRLATHADIEAFGALVV